ncbi:MAG TPA: calcium/sodium antiporter [Phycisphaerae bacterium]|nr:calcium/sodium antiporter [Phycisphaerae bacterium]
MFALMLLGGLALLVVGANWLVDGASAVARRLGVSDLVIGLTVVAFGTSAPELVVDVFAAARGNTDIAVANILGSNTFNILAILGLSALVRPLAVAQSTVWKEIPLSLLAAVLVGILGNNALLDGAGPNALTRTDGLVLLGFFVIFLYYVLGMAKSSANPPDPPGQISPPAMRLPAACLRIGAGLAALATGAHLAVAGAVDTATRLGVSERVIGLTIVAVGTSLPELATSVVAAYRRNADLAVGNIVGSNLFNIFFILGVSACIRPLPMGGQVNFDVAATVLASLLLFVSMFTGRPRHGIQRWEGAVYLAAYAAYLGLLLGKN